MEIFFFLFLAGFGIAAYQDWKNNTINDLIPATLWVLAGITGYSWGFGGLVFGFGSIFLINAFTANFLKWHFFSWGDILLIPLFIFGSGFIRNKTIVFPFILAGVLAPLIMTTIKKKKVAVAPILFIFYLLAGIAYLIG